MGRTAWWHAGLAALRLAARFVTATMAGRLVALTMALCAAVSFLELGMSYRTKAFAGAALAVTASVTSELGFGLFMRAQSARRAHRWRAAIRGTGAVGGAIFASGGLDALGFWASARTALLPAIVWVAIGPVLAEVIVAYEAWGEATGRRELAERNELGAVALRALLGAAALGGLAVYGLAHVLPRGVVAAAAADRRGRLALRLGTGLRRPQRLGPGGRRARPRARAPPGLMPAEQRTTADGVPVPLVVPDRPAGPLALWMSHLGGSKEQIRQMLHTLTGSASASPA